MILYRECILKHSSFPLFLLCPGLWQPFFGSAEHRKRNPTDRLPGRWGDLFSVGRGNEVEPQKWWRTTPPPEQSFVGNFFPFEGGDLSKHVWWQFLCFFSSLLHFDWIPNPPNCRWRSAVRYLSTFHPRQIGIRGPRWPRFRRHHLICHWLGVSEIRCKTARHIARVHSFWGYDTWNFSGWLLKFLVFSFGTPRLREGFLNFEQHMSCFFRWFKPATHSGPYWQVHWFADLGSSLSCVSIAIFWWKAYGRFSLYFHWNLVPPQCPHNANVQEKQAWNYHDNFSDLSDSHPEVIMKGDKEIVGTLRGFDDYVNMVMDASSLGF